MTTSWIQKEENGTVSEVKHVDGPRVVLRAPVGRQRGGKQLWGLCDVVVVGAAYRLAARGGRGRGLHADLLQALVLQDTHTKQKNAHSAIRKTAVKQSFPSWTRRQRFVCSQSDGGRTLCHVRSHKKRCAGSEQPCQAIVARVTVIKI